MKHAEDMRFFESKSTQVSETHDLAFGVHSEIEQDLKAQRFLRQAMKFGPVKIEDSETGDIFYNVPQNWTGRLSGVAFELVVSEGETSMEMTIPGRDPLPLVLPMADEETIFEYSRTADLAFALASEGQGVAQDLVQDNAFALSWFCGLMRSSACVARGYIDEFLSDSSASGVSEESKSSLYASARSLDTIAGRLEKVLAQVLDTASFELFASQKSGARIC